MMTTWLLTNKYTEMRMMPKVDDGGEDDINKSMHGGNELANHSSSNFTLVSY